jgi:transcriptional regulator with XRE-family HTH domain
MLTLRTMANTFGEEIRKYRLIAEYTLREFAKIIDVAPSHLSDIELDRRRPSAELLKKIAHHLAKAGASLSRFEELDTRTDPETKKWMEKNAGAQQIMRLSRESGKSVDDILRALKKSLKDLDKGKQPE